MELQITAEPSLMLGPLADGLQQMLWGGEVWFTCKTGGGMAHYANPVVVLLYCYLVQVISVLIVQYVGGW